MNLIAVSSSGLALSIEALGWTLLHFVWQGALVGLVLLAVLVLARNSSAQLRYLAACGALCLMFAAAVSTFVWQFAAVTRTTSQTSMVALNVTPLPVAKSDGVAWLTVNASASHRVPPNVTAQVTNHAGPAARAMVTVGDTRALLGVLSSFPPAAAGWTRRLEPWLPSIVSLWALGVAFFSLRLLIGWREVRGLCATGAAFPDEFWLTRFAALQERVGLAFPVRLVSSTSAAVPMVIGWLKPVVLVPAGLVAGLGAAQLEAILLHELIHIRRHDFLVNLLQNFLETLFFYHPAVTWVSGRIRVERENCCDDAASVSSGGTLDYARALAAMAELRRAPALGLAANGGSLVERIRRLVAATQIDERRRMSSGAATLLPLAIAVAALVTLGAAVAQQQANEPGRMATSAGRTPATSEARNLKARPGDAVVISGQVLKPDGRPAARADVAVIGRSKGTQRGGEWTDHTDTLVQDSTDHTGRFRLTLANFSWDSYWSLTLIAGTPGYGFAWRTLDPSVARPNGLAKALTLAPEEILRARLVDLQGQSAAGVRLHVQSVAEPRDPASGGVYLGRIAGAPGAGPPPVVSDEHGRISLRGIPHGDGVFLAAEGNVRFAPQVLAFNTGMPETRGERDATYRPQVVRNLKSGEEAVLPLVPAQVIEGTVRFADTKQPVPHAKMTIYANDQKIGGSGTGMQGRTDAHGHFRLIPDPGVAFGITAYPPDRTPYLIRTERLPWKAGMVEAHVQIDLPRGVLARGTVVEAGSGAPIANAAVQYIPESATERRSGEAGGSGEGGMVRSDSNGRFAISVLPGVGRLLVHAPRRHYLYEVMGQRELDGLGTGGQRNYAHAIKRIDPVPGSGPLEMTIALRRGVTATGRLLLPDGRPAENVLVLSRLQISPFSTWWRAGFEEERAYGGQFSISGLAAGVEYPVSFLDPDRRLGATLLLKAADAAKGPIDVHLKPCGTAKARFVDFHGKPIAGVKQALFVVVTPGPPSASEAARLPGIMPADEDFVVNSDRKNHPEIERTDQQGRVVYGTLIPGTTYRLLGPESMGRVFNKDFTVKAGENVDLGDLLADRPQEHG
jgi:beta-lactamase regulating signal transducer with metallopeptidase domain